MAQLFDLCISSLLGLFREGVVRGDKTFSDLDEMELREFLLKHGCRTESLSSPALDRLLRHRVRVRGRRHRRPAPQYRRRHRDPRDAADVLRIQGLIHVEDAGRHG